MSNNDWKKALDYILLIAQEQGVSQSKLSEGIISLNHFNLMCNGKEKIKAWIVFECAKKVGIDDETVVKIARSEESNLLLCFQKKLEQILLIQDYQSLFNLEREVAPYKDEDKFFSQLYYQILGLIEGALHKRFDIALNYFEKAVKIVYPKFYLETDSISIHLSEMDIEILGAIAICYKNMKEYNKAISIYILLLNYLEINQYKKNFYPKFCYNLSRTYEKTENYQEMFQCANKGIEYSKKNQLYDQFGYLYFAKAIAEYYLDIDNTESFDCCIYHYKLQGRSSEFIKQIKNDKQKYSKKNR